MTRVVKLDGRSALSKQITPSGGEGCFESSSGSFFFSFCLKERRALRLVPVSGIDRENLILLYSRNRNCFIEEWMSILSFPAAKHIRRIFYIALRHCKEALN